MLRVDPRSQKAIGHLASAVHQIVGVLNTVVQLAVADHGLRAVTGLGVELRERYQE